MSNGVVVLPRWKFVLLLAVGISISAGVAIALNAFVAVKRGGEDVLPLVLSDSFWVCVWSFLVGMAMLAVIGMFVKGGPDAAGEVYKYPNAQHCPQSSQSDEVFENLERRLKNGVCK